MPPHSGLIHMNGSDAVFRAKAVHSLFYFASTLGIKSVFQAELLSKCKPSRFRRGLQHSQRKLLIALAVVDLLTATIVLPCDIAHKIFTLLNIRIYCDLNMDNLAYGLIDNARNIMFALEGSILTSIALDRFLVIGCPYVRNISSKWRACTSSVSELSSGHISSPDMLNEPTSTHMTGNEDIYISSEVAPQVDFKLPRRSERQARSVLLPNTPSKLHRQFLDKKRARLHSDGSVRLSRSRRTALTLFIATLVFYLTLLPVLIVHFGNWSNDSGTREDIAKDVHMHFSAAYIHHEFYYINNAVNFFIYSWVSPAFRRRLRELCKRN
ncbi:hypothetical protein TcWFU_004916 [Taenia crassiceps]|uniref:G-protein coupled receptors family 1 profile domain-containing protein n=1 Tax=Taenia crassiceps TaxID=6207 RepID=A0ABR4QDW1_9CEST